MTSADEDPQNSITAPRHVAPRRRDFAQGRTRSSVESELARLAARVEELEREREELIEDRTAIENFAAMAAHEVLRPLVLTAACAEGIRERAGDQLDPDSQLDLEILARVSHQVRGLVEALLADARADGRPMHLQPVDLTKVVGDSLEMLKLEIDAREAQVDVEPMPVVRGNAALLTGVFGNLLSNALKYGPRSGGEIQVSVSRDSAGWVFAVDSPGPPIPEDDRERVFEPWQRGLGERRAKGAGLGLAIVRRIVERHGGQVGVSSPSDSTNRFFFTLPS